MSRAGAQEDPQPRRADDTLDDTLDDIVAACIESGPAEVDDAIDRACAAHPGSSDEIRGRIAKLRAVGLLRPPGVVDDERFPEVLGEFRLLERLGSGGMGVVFRARQETLGREVALKLIRPEHLYFPRARERFRRETEAAARLQHAGIVPIYSVGEANGIPFFAMELVGGATLADALRRLSSLAPERLQGGDLARALRQGLPSWAHWNESQSAEAFGGAYVDCILRLAIQVAEALHHAHERGVLHRDVKPANIAVTSDGRALLFDFGLARLGDDATRMTQTRTEIGSLEYMSPEQLRDARASHDRRSDVYSLGVTLYELLALQAPFVGADAIATRRAILEGAASPLRARNRAVPRDLELVCAKAMEREAARRYVDAAAFARDLRNVLERRPVEARAPSAALHLRRWTQRHPVATVALIALVAAPTALYVQQRVHANALGIALAETEHQRQKANADARDANAINGFLLTLFESVDPGHAHGRDITARDLLDEGAKRLESDLTEQPLVRARLLDAIGASYTSLDEWERAERTLQLALELREANAGGESLEMMQSLQTLSVLERQLGRPTAVVHARRSIELRRKLIQAPNAELADALIDLAMALEEVAQVGEADRAYSEALAVVEQLPGDHREQHGTVLANIANVRLQQERPELAIAAAREAIADFRSQTSDPHPGVTSCLNAEALALSKLERYDEARVVFDELLEQEGRLTGTESTRYATFLASKSNIEVGSGRLGEAIALLERADALFVRIAPPTHDNAMHCLQLLGAAYARAGRWEDARAALRRLVPAIESSLGREHVRVLSSLALIGLCDEALSDWTVEETDLQDAIDRAVAAQTTADDGWESEANALLARLLARRGEFGRARELVARARALRSDSELKFGACAWTRLAAGVIAQGEGDFDGAREQLRDLAALDRGPTHGENAPAIARARLAAIEARTDPVRARPLLAESAAELECLLGPGHPEAREVAALLDGLR